MVASNSGGLVDASGYKFSEKDTKPGKIKLKKSGVNKTDSGGHTKTAKKPEASGEYGLGEFHGYCRFYEFLYYSFILI